MVKKKITSKTAKKKIAKTKKNVNLEKKEPSQQQEIVSDNVRVLADKDVLSGNYSNVAVIHHTKREFVLDFVFAIASQHSLVSRVITSPQHIKKIHEVLGENIKQYEKNFGEIEI